VIGELFRKERRRKKVLFNLRYLNKKVSFGGFGELIGLKKMIRDNKLGLFSGKLMEKLRCLFKNYSH
jgi:hypothetical protein